MDEFDQTKNEAAENQEDKQNRDGRRYYIGLVILVVAIYLVLAWLFCWWPFLGCGAGRTHVNFDTSRSGAQVTNVPGFSPEASSNVVAGEVILGQEAQASQTPPGGVEDHEFRTEPIDAVSLIYTNPIDQSLINTQHIYLLRDETSKVPVTYTYDEGYKKVRLMLLQSIAPPASGTLRLTVVSKNIKDESGNAVPDFIYHIDLTKTLP